MKFRWFRRMLNFEERPEDSGNSRNPRNEFHDSSIILAQGVYRQSVDEDGSVDDEVVLRRPQNNATASNSRNTRRHNNSDRESFFEKFIPFRSTLNLARFSLESEHHISSIQMSSHMNEHRQQDIESQMKNDKLKKMIHERLSMQNMSMSMPNLSAIKEHQQDHEHVQEPPKNGVPRKSSHKRPHKRPPPQPPLQLAVAVDTPANGNEPEPVKPPRRKPTSPVAVVAPLLDIPVNPPEVKDASVNPPTPAPIPMVVEDEPTVLEPAVTMRAATSDHSLDSDTESMTPSIRFSMSELNSVLVATTPAIVIQEVEDDDENTKDISQESTNYAAAVTEVDIVVPKLEVPNEEIKIKTEIPTPAKRAPLVFLKELHEKFKQESVEDDVEVATVTAEPTKFITVVDIRPNVEDPPDVPTNSNLNHVEVTVNIIDNSTSINDVTTEATEIQETSETSETPVAPAVDDADKREVTDKVAENPTDIPDKAPDFPEAVEIIEIPISTFSGNIIEQAESTDEKLDISKKPDAPLPETENTNTTVAGDNQVDTEPNDLQQVAPIPPKRHSKARKEPPQVAPRKSLELLNGVDQVDTGDPQGTTPEQQLKEIGQEKSEDSQPNQNQNGDEVQNSEDPEDTTTIQYSPKSILKSTSESSSERTNMTIRFHDEISEIRSNFHSLTPIREDAAGIEEEEDSETEKDEKHVEFSVWDAMEDHRISLEHLNKKKTTTPPPSPISLRKSDEEIIILKTA